MGAAKSKSCARWHFTAMSGLRTAAKCRLGEDGGASTPAAGEEQADVFLAARTESENCGGEAQDRHQRTEHDCQACEVFVNGHCGAPSI
jgi:hypothetical protein